MNKKLVMMLLTLVLGLSACGSQSEKPQEIEVKQPEKEIEKPVEKEPIKESSQDVKFDYDVTTYNKHFFLTKEGKLYRRSNGETELVTDGVSLIAEETHNGNTAYIKDGDLYLVKVNEQKPYLLKQAVGDVKKVIFFDDGVAYLTKSGEIFACEFAGESISYIRLASKVKGKALNIYKESEKPVFYQIVSGVSDFYATKYYLFYLKNNELMMMNYETHSIMKGIKELATIEGGFDDTLLLKNLKDEVLVTDNLDTFSDVKGEDTIISKVVGVSKNPLQRSHFFDDQGKLHVVYAFDESLVKEPKNFTKELIKTHDAQRPLVHVTFNKFEGKIVSLQDTFGDFFALINVEKLDGQYEQINLATDEVKSLEKIDSQPSSH